MVFAAILAPVIQWGGQWTVDQVGPQDKGRITQLSLFGGPASALLSLIFLHQAPEAIVLMGMLVAVHGALGSAQLGVIVGNAVSFKKKASERIKELELLEWQNRLD